MHTKPQFPTCTTKNNNYNSDALPRLFIQCFTHQAEVFLRSICSAKTFCCGTVWHVLYGLLNNIRALFCCRNRLGNILIVSGCNDKIQIWPLFIHHIWSRNSCLFRICRNTRSSVFAAIRWMAALISSSERMGSFTRSISSAFTFSATCGVSPDLPLRFLYKMLRHGIMLPFAAK